MKNIFHVTAVVLLILVISCSKKDTDPVPEIAKHSYQISWDANKEPDIIHYDLYVWSGLDSTKTPFEDNTSAYRYIKYFVKSVKDTSTNILEIADGKSFIQIALSAVNSNGSKSQISVSNFRKAVDSHKVSKPQN